MKPIINILFLISILFSCKSDDNRIESFNELIPLTDKVVLDSWVKFYDELVKVNYPILGTKKLLRDILDNRTSNWKYDKQHLCSILGDFKQSSLEI